MSEVAFSELVGKTIVNIDVYGADDEEDSELRFTVDNGDQYRLYHDQCCCESVVIEDICGDLDDLIGVPVLMAAEVSSENKIPEEVFGKAELTNGLEFPDYYMSCTWTFYRIATIKGTVVIRWLGESNGYYSESVDFELIEGSNAK